MSRIGIKPVVIPEGVTVTVKPGLVTVSGERGSLTQSIPTSLAVAVNDNQLVVTRTNEAKATKALHGTLRALVSNMVTGVSVGWQKKLEIHGSGYRATVEGDQLTLLVGFSHPVTLTLPTGIEAKIVKHTLTISGNDRQVVGEIAAKIRRVRPPEPYKGKGIRYRDEHIPRKVGKAIKATA